MPTGRRSRALLGLTVVILSLTSCFTHRARVLPSVDSTLSSRGMIGKQVLLATAHGPVGMWLDSLRYPYIMGSATTHGGTAQVRIDRYDGYAEVVLDDAGRIVSRRTLAARAVRSNPGDLVGKSIRFTSSTGAIVLRDVTRVESPWAVGRLVAGDGPIRADLREGQTLSVAELNVGGSVVRTMVFVAVIASVLFGAFIIIDPNIFD